MIYQQRHCERFLFLNVHEQNINHQFLYCYISLFFGLSYYGYTFNLPEFLCSLLDIAPTLRNFLCPIYDLIVLFKTSRLGEGRERKGGCFRCVYMCSYMSVCAYIYMFYSSHEKMQLHLLSCINTKHADLFLKAFYQFFSIFLSESYILTNLMQEDFFLLLGKYLVCTVVDWFCDSFI